MSINLAVLSGFERASQTRADDAELGCNDGPEGSLQWDYEAYFTNTPDGDSRPWAGGVLRKISNNLALFTDAEGLSYMLTNCGATSIAQAAAIPAWQEHYGVATSARCTNAFLGPYRGDPEALMQMKSDWHELVESLPVGESRPWLGDSTLTKLEDGRMQLDLPYSVLGFGGEHSKIGPFPPELLFRLPLMPRQIHDDLEAKYDVHYEPHHWGQLMSDDPMVEDPMVEVRERLEAVRGRLEAIGALIHSPGS